LTIANSDRGNVYDCAVTVGWQSTVAGKHLARRKNENTAPELLLRRAVHSVGLRFRLHVRLAAGCTPDLLFSRYRLAVFVDGDFWHGCPEHGRKTPFTGPNAALWEEKMRRNRVRDDRSTRIAQDQGYKVLRLWECQVTTSPATAARLVQEACGGHADD
jgi:DNA mismatch endonuclease (patch repair protein)